MKEPKLYFKPVTRESFFKMFPPETRGIYFQTPDGKIEQVAALGEEVVCDLCNGDVFTEETPFGYLMVIDGHICDTYCSKCYHRHKEHNPDCDEDNDKEINNKIF